MLAMILAGAVAAGAWAKAVTPAGWSELDRGHDAVAFTRPPDGLQTRSHPSAWLRVEYRKAQAPFGYLSSSVLAHIDCEAKAYTLTDFSFFPRRNLSGKPSSMPYPDKPAPIAPGSRLEALSSTLCAAP